MTLRLQLLLLSLLTLLLPWGGCRYAREVESVLREGEQQALLSAANTLAAVLATEPAAVDPRLAATGFDPAAGDLYVHRLRTRPLLDGYADEWNIPETAFRHISADGGALQVQYLAATDEQNFYLLCRITDPLVRLEQTADNSLPPEERADHFWLSLPAADGAARDYLFITSAPGLIGAHRLTAPVRGQRGNTTEPRIQAWWQPEADGYRLEISVPQTMVEGRVGFEAVDVGDFTMGPVRVGTLDPQTHQPRSGRLLQPAVALEQKLATLLPPGTRALVANENGWILAQTGALTPAQARPYERSADWLQAIYRRLLESGREALPVRPAPPGRIGGAHADAALAGRTGSTWFRLPDERRSVLAVAVPLAGATGASPAQPTSVLVLEQTGERLLVLRDRALTRLLNLTLLVTGAAVLAIFIFATVLGLRLGRLKRAAETALTHEGRINSAMPETRAGDELGDLARSYQRLLGQLNEYTGYLRTLAGKLAHELRTPLTIVRSSIENLESERTATSPDLYLARAREGADRLQGILTAMSAATRTEEAIRHAERRTFDLDALVVSMARAYADAFPARRFEARTPGEPCRVDGAPDLIAQLLDKLIDNAVDFSAAGSLIPIELRICPAGEVELCVINTGPPIPPALRGRMFESMFQLRGAAGEARSTGVHFGLGLYVVRLIAEFHRGEPFAQNLEEPGVVRIGIRLPHA